MPEVDEDEYQGYHRFVTDDGLEYGSFEVFYSGDWGSNDPHDLPDCIGWMWWACFPGCLPDGDPDGPYETSDAAYHAARGE